MTDPHNCDDFKDDTKDTADLKRVRLVDHLSQSWALREAAVIRRYDNEDIAGTIYNGWAIWEVGNVNAPTPG